MTTQPIELSEKVLTAIANSRSIWMQCEDYYLSPMDIAAAQAAIAADRAEHDTRRCVWVGSEPEDLTPQCEQFHDTYWIGISRHGEYCDFCGLRIELKEST